MRGRESRAALRLALWLGVICGVWAVVLHRGVLGGPFWGIALEGLFFFGLSLASARLLLRMIRESGPRLGVYLSYTILGRLLLEILFVLVGMWLSGSHILGFTAVAVCCQVVSQLWTVRALRGAIRRRQRGA